MNLFQPIYDEQRKARLEEAANEVRREGPRRTYYEENRAMYVLAKLGTFAVLGFSLTATLVFTYINFGPLAAIPVGFFALLGEVAKATFSFRFFRDLKFYGETKPGKLLLVLAVCVCEMIFHSASGHIIVINSQKADISAVTNMNTGSASAEVAAIQAQHREISARRDASGRLIEYNDNKRLKALEKSLEKAQERAGSETAAALALGQKALALSDAKAEAGRKLFYLLAALVGLTVVVLSWFRAHYLFRSIVELDDARQSRGGAEIEGAEKGELSLKEGEVCRMNGKFYIGAKTRDGIKPLSEVEVQRFISIYEARSKTHNNLEKVKLYRDYLNTLSNAAQINSA